VGSGSGETALNVSGWRKAGSGVWPVGSSPGEAAGVNSSGPPVELVFALSGLMGSPKEKGRQGVHRRALNVAPQHIFPSPYPIVI